MSVLQKREMLLSELSKLGIFPDCNGTVPNFPPCSTATKGKTPPQFVQGLETLCTLLFSQ